MAQPMKNRGQQHHRSYRGQ